MYGWETSVGTRFPEDIQRLIPAQPNFGNSGKLIHTTTLYFVFRKILERLF